MFCTNCGRPTTNSNGICDECAAGTMSAGFQENKQQIEINPGESYNNYNNNYNSGNSPQFTRKYGLGAAIACAVLGTIAAFFSGLAMGFATAMRETSTSSIAGVSATPFIIIAVVLCIPTIILGIKSIISFFYARKHGGPAPIATLVCGIEGLVCAGTALIYVLMTLLVINAPESAVTSIALHF